MNRIALQILTVLMVSACANRIETEHSEMNINFNSNLKQDLEKYNGYYSEIENEGGTIKEESLPSDIINYKNTAIDSIQLKHLNRIESGYYLICNIDYSGNNILFVSTLDEKYSLVDYKLFPNGSDKLSPELDTIAVPVFNQNQIEIQLLRPNEFEEPSYNLNGIKKVKLTITKDLKLKS